MGNPADFFGDMIRSLSPQDMNKARTIGTERRRILTEGQKPNDENYGLSVNNPICVSTIESSERYLSALRLEKDNSSFSFSRNGSITTTISGVLGTSVDEYEIIANNSTKDKFTIYICPYGHDGTYCPKGFKIKDYKKSSVEDELTANVISYVLGLKSLEMEIDNTKKSPVTDIDKKVKNIVPNKSIKDSTDNKNLICIKCKKAIPEDSEFCPYCGTEAAKELQKNICPECNNEIPEDSEFCPFCGNKVIAKLQGNKCNNCGKIVPEDSEFCPYCGSSIDAKPQPVKSIENRCDGCGKIIPKDSEFCPFCGATTGNNSPTVITTEKHIKKAKKAHPEFLDYESDNDMVITIVKYASIGLLALFVILYWALAHKMMPGSGTSQLLAYILSALVFTGACVYSGLNIFKKNIFAVNVIIGGVASIFIILIASFNIAYSYKSVDYITRVDWDKAPIRVSIDANYYSDEIKKVHNASVKMRLGDKGAAWFKDNDVAKVDAGEQYDVYLKCGYSKSKAEKNVGLVKITKNDIINGGTMNYDVKIDDYVSAGVIVYYELDDSFWRVVFS